MDDAGQAGELALLAAPLPGDAPAGADLRQDFSPQSLYYRLRDARAEAREMERRIDTDAPDAEAGMPMQWRTVRELSVKALSESTKDLEIAAWLTEALVRLNGLAGMAAGAHLMAELAATLWDNDLYPVPDEDGIATRVAPVAGLNGQGGDGTLMQPLRKCVLFVLPDGTPISYFDYLQSEEVEKIADAKRRKQRQDGGVKPFEDLTKAARANGPASGADHFAKVRATTKAALASWTTLGTLLDERAGADSPSTTQVRTLLIAILDIAQQYAPPEREGEAAADVAEETAPAADDAATGAPLPPGTLAAASAVRPVTRDDMLRELGRIAEFFRRTEPHSPLSYTLEEAIRRGRLTWPELLQEVVPDGGARSAMLVMLGIRPSQETEDQK